MNIKAEQIEIVDLSLLVPYDKNANRHPPEQIEKLERAIKYQGFRVPLVVCRETMRIAAGHGRYEAAKRLGMKRVPVIFQDFEDEAQFYAFTVSDNALAEYAELDLAKINDTFHEFGPDFDLDLLFLNKFDIDPEPAKEDKEESSTDVAIYECPNCQVHFELSQAERVE